MMDILPTTTVPQIADLLIRATALLCGATVLGLALRKRTAAVRHASWSVAFVALLVLPVATWAGVRWEVPLLPATVPAQSSPARPAPAVSADPTPTVQSLDAVTPQMKASVVAPVEEPGLGLMGLAWLVWATGTAGAVLSLVLGFTRMRRIVRAATPDLDADWARRLAAAKRTVGLRRRVRLLMSSHISTPLTTGLIRPVILLPAEAGDWSEARRDVVLQHELVHVRRYDAVRQALGQLALGLYWFHPLSWLASRLSVAVREEACDEAVVALGTRPSDYAGHLLDLARGADARPLASALPMVQPSQLERRIMAILRQSRPRDTMLLTTVAFAAITSLGVVAATLQPTPLASQVDDEPAVAPVPAPMAAVPVGASRPVVSDRAAPSVSRQEMTCRVDGVRGSFNGTFSTRSNRTEMVGRHNGDRMIQKYEDDLRMCMRIHGDVVMDDDAWTVRAMARDAWVVIETEEDVLHRLVITEGPSGIEHVWSVDGQERAYDQPAQEWTRTMYTILDGYQEAGAIRGQQSSLRGKISSHRGQISSMKGQISSHRGRVSSLRGQISSHRGRASSVRGQISSLRGQVSSLKGAVASHHGQIASLRSAARATSDEQTRAALDREISQHEDAIRSIQRDIEDFGLDSRVDEKEREIEALEVQRRVEELEREISEYDLEGRVREIEEQIEAYDLEGKVRQIEREIEELDADRRAEAIERSLEPRVRELRALLRGLR